MKPKPFIEHHALFSPCGRYRYGLSRTWDPGTRKVCWIMLNPSTATAEKNDATIRRCIDFAFRWQYGGIVVVNLFALIATYPSELARAKDAIGPLNDEVILEAIKGSLVICAWGNVPNCPWLVSRSLRVASLLTQTQTPLKCLGLTAGGHPSHPLRLPKSRKPIAFNRSAS